MTSLKKSSCLGTCIVLLTALAAGCSSSASPAPSTGPTGGTQSIKGIAVPHSVAVVTATNAT